MKKLVCVAIGFVLAAVVVLVKGAEVGPALVVAALYAVPVLLACVLPGWTALGASLGVPVLMLIFGPTERRSGQDGLLYAWGWLLFWITAAAAVAVAWAWFSSRRARAGSGN
ncbi:hypothetical protein [Actinokineospora globicatena]|uniref:hypothetical protein n=1 Tax=Actinokineospora globicatena TaxID=103729 RepID=UPI0020A3AA82|nr:hypothetical protein [Actinokineospora globicatena]MCP2303716.1 hypothetical protein [Actinokineospora globicatena]GLW79138.1 hypothetical protein Aglo01_36200 [Actinokineospora globicatena]GLW86452.1 hypothetical protein Aglo02_40910 [Actinokineospora globicatena]